jgi:hypothetical protein
MEEVDVDKLKETAKGYQETAKGYQKSATDSFTAFSERVTPSAESKQDATEAAERMKQDAQVAAEKAAKTASDAYTKMKDSASEEAEVIKLLGLRCASCDEPLFVQKFAKEFETVRDAKEKLEQASQKAADLKTSYLGVEYVFPLSCVLLWCYPAFLSLLSFSPPHTRYSFFANAKESIQSAAKELFAMDAEEKTINKPIYAPVDSFSQQKKKKKREFGEKAEEEVEEDKAEPAGVRIVDSMAYPRYPLTH